MFWPNSADLFGRLCGWFALMICWVLFACRSGGWFSADVCWPICWHLILAGSTPGQVRKRGPSWPSDEIRGFCEEAGNRRTPRAPRAPHWRSKKDFGKILDSLCRPWVGRPRKQGIREFISSFYNRPFHKLRHEYHLPRIQTIAMVITSIET